MLLRSAWLDQAQPATVEIMVREYHILARNKQVPLNASIQEIGIGIDCDRHHACVGLLIELGKDFILIRHFRPILRDYIRFFEMKAVLRFIVCFYISAGTEKQRYSQENAHYRDPCGCVLFQS